MDGLNKTLKILLVLSIILLIASYFQKNNLPSQNEINPELMQDPVQTTTDKKPFEYTQSDISYIIILSYFSQP